MQTPDPEAWRLAQAAGAAFARRDFAAARQLAQQVIARRPLDANGNQILGLVAMEEGDFAAAKRHLERANQAAPNQPHIMNALGVSLRRLGDVEAARPLFTRAGEGGLIDGWRNLGNLENGARNAEAAMAAYRRALKIAPNDAAAHAGLARGYEAGHDLAKAKQHAEAALKNDANNEIARIALAQVLMREKDAAGAEAAAAPIVANRGASPTNAALAWGIIGDARDRRGAAHAAFEAYTNANQILLKQNAALLNASHLLYHPDGVARMSALVAASDIASWRPAAASAFPAPVFLVGFPRSGTTLLDQILSSHSAIFCIEEREHFANALASVISDEAKLAGFAALSDAEIEAARAEYWRRVRAEDAPPADALVVDKLPLNIVVLPLIKRVFPDAKIIFALRDPRDVILSCYVQRFGMNAAMAQFLELGRAARYYDAVMRLMSLCREKLALHLHQVRYEDVVADIGREARALADFLGLPFEEAMLSFRETALARDINTPSARQVIEPIYTRSVQKWRRYEAELATALPLLNQWAARFGYQT
ncbi:MAG TPA: sulfotransferase [Vitreimonas sp.]|nr:sulfotransferase [Vitreimonas sp.]